MCKKRKKLGESYKFKYIYLLLIIGFVGVIVILDLLPTWLPDVITAEKWIIDKNLAGTVQEIKFVPQNVPSKIVNFFKDIFVSGLVGILLYSFYEHRFESEEKQKLFDSVNDILSQNIETHIAKAILSSKKISEEIFSDDMLDEVIFNCLSRKYGNEGKAEALMNVLLGNAVKSCSIVRDLDVSMTLSRFCDENHRYSKYDTYQMTYTIRYKVVLNSNVIIFILTNNKAIQNSHLGPFTYCQFVDSLFSREEVFFQINEVTIDGVRLQKIEDRIQDAEYIEEEYWDDSCNEKKGKEVQICYSVNFLTRKRGNHYSYFSPFMAEGIHLRFDASSTDLKRIKLLTYFNSAEKPTIIPAPGTEDNPKVIEISLNDWILPQSGATFIWQYEKK